MGPRTRWGPEPATSHTFFTIDIANVGGADAKGLTVRVQFGAGVTITLRQTLGDVPAGEAVRFELDTNTVPAPYYCATLDPDGLIDEADESNNTVCAVIGGALGLP